MKKLNFNLKDRKVLYGILGIVLVSVFTLTVAYAALNAVLTINGNAKVNAADWDIHFDNVKVANGSVSGADPVIISPITVTFSTILNMPGDFYEFTIDVINAGDIDAMIENVVKTPTLSSNQAKYLKYEITYQNSEAITTKQLVEKKSFVRLKVRVEYRSDISSTDLPTTSETLNLGLKLDYTQSDGSGSSVTDNGMIVPVANGDINDIGTIVTIGTEKFYTIGTEMDNVKLFAMYNLYVGGYYDASSVGFVEYGSEATGMQDEKMSWPIGSSYRAGVTAFSSDTKKGVNYSDYNGSIVEEYVNNYRKKLENKFDLEVVDARLISLDEVVDSNLFGCSITSYKCSNDLYSWLFDTSTWIGTAYDDNNTWGLLKNAIYWFGKSSHAGAFGVRPVIIISKDYFN